jgi:ATP-dependent RNA helicase DDX5/DBP2
MCCACVNVAHYYLQDIDVVVNFDLPVGKLNGIENYVHRIGRTARGNRTGVAHSFVTPEDENITRDLIAVLEESGQVCA